MNQKDRIINMFNNGKHPAYISRHEKISEVVVREILQDAGVVRGYIGQEEYDAEPIVAPYPPLYQEK